MFAPKYDEEALLPIVLDEGETLCTIRLAGVVDVNCAQELKVVLLQALTSGKSLRVELADSTEVDITALQLFWAAGREAKASGIRYELQGELPASVAITVSNAGFESFPIDRM